ncbi:MAG TPA: hypothetical protein VFW88_09880 [Burkholderiales bacterium]|nr:hypothetical protein [Burkholderiales bacterium]
MGTFRKIPYRHAMLLGAALLAGCATVSTHVVLLNPGARYPPTKNVRILLEKPKQPYHEIAIIDARGSIGGSEAQLLEEARNKAKTLGADAIVRLASNTLYEPPVAIYDPWFDPFYYRMAYYQPFWWNPSYYGEYRLIGGGYYYTLKALAIRFEKQPESDADHAKRDTVLPTIRLSAR